MKIQPPPTEKKSSSKAGIIVLILLVLLGAGGFIAWNIINTPAPAPKASVLFQSFTGKVSTSEDGSAWKAPSYGNALKPFSSVKNGEDAEADFKYNETGFLRLKNDSSMEYTSPSRYSTDATGRMHLENGMLLIASGNENLQVSTLGRADRGLLSDMKTRFINIPAGSFVMVRASEKTKSAMISVLRGRVTVESHKPPFALQLADSEMAEISGTGEVKKGKNSQEVWKDAREAYELKPKSAATEAAQLDIAKKAGNFFQYVIDHGTFYQQKWGWCEREFVAPEDGTMPYLETTYDVFPRASWVGVYIKTRDLDLSKFKAFKIEARRIPGRPFPAFVRIEFKAKAQVLQAFAIKMINTDWENIEFPVRLSKESMITEVTFIFTHEKVGNDKAGGFQIRNFTLIPADPKEEKPHADIEAGSSKLPVTVGVNERAITKNTGQPATTVVGAPAPAAVKPTPAAPPARVAAAKPAPSDEPAEDSDIPESEDLSDF